MSDTGLFKEQDIFVSIIIPVYNSEGTIEDCLKSLVNQNYDSRKYEIIIVDDGSIDSSLQIINKYPVKVLHQNRKGPAAARNNGVHNSRGELILFLDSDCIVDSDWVDAHCAVHNSKYSNNRLGCIGGPILLFKKSNSFVEICDYYASWYEQPIIRKTAEYEYFPSTNLSISKKIFIDLGGFNEELFCGEDVEFGIRLRKAGFSLLYVQNIKVFHCSRQTWKDYLYHHYMWGVYAPKFRKFSSDAKYSMLFYPNRIYSIFISPFVALLYMFYVVLKWCYKGKVVTIFLSPIIFLSKIFFAFGMVKGIYQLTEK